MDGPFSPPPLPRPAASVPPGTLPDKPPRRRPVRAAALVLTALSLVLSAILARGRFSALFADGTVGALLLARELDAPPDFFPPDGASASSSGPSSASPAPSDPAAEPTAPPPAAPSTTAAAPRAANGSVPPPAVSSVLPGETERVITTAIRGAEVPGLLNWGDVYVKNNTRYAPDLAALAAASLVPGGRSAVLIVHTHATEAYTPTALDAYRTDPGDRSEDASCSVVRVGDELARRLESLGIPVFHDRTLFDAGSYDGAYDRSSAAVRRWLESHPEIAVVLDVHRDALNAEGAVRYRLAVDSGGRDAAQIMIVCGTDAGGADHPGWRKNLGLALRLAAGLERLCPGVTRPVLLTNSAYEQQVSPGALLVEIGTNGNSLSDALTSADLLARSLAGILNGAA